MAGGYQASAQQIGQAGKSISDDANNMQKTLKDMTPTQIADADFGNAHKQHQADYKTAVDEFGKGVAGMTTVLDTFTTTLGATGSDYANTEGDNTSTLNNSGGN